MRVSKLASQPHPVLRVSTLLLGVDFDFFPPPPPPRVRDRLLVGHTGAPNRDGACHPKDLRRNMNEGILRTRVSYDEKENRGATLATWFLHHGLAGTSECIINGYDM